MTGMADTPAMANKVLTLLSKAFNLAEVWGWRPEGTNPCRHVGRFQEESRERFLSQSELNRLGKTLAEAETAWGASPHAWEPLMWQKPEDLLSPTLTDQAFEHPLLKQYCENERPRLEHLPRELRELVTCIHQNIFEPGLNVKTVREICRIRDNNISSRFRRAVGSGIKSYIDSHRMAAAKTLLLKSDLPIFDVAMAVGYSHVETFYQVFRRHFSCTPGHYRRTEAS